MTDDEAKQFRHQLIAVYFPSLGEWFEGLPDKNATWGVWREALRPFSLDECMSVLRRWSDGTLEPFKHYERERVYLFVRAIIERDRSKERSKAANQDTCQSVIGSGGSPVAPVLANAVKMATQGFTEDDILAYIDQSFPSRPEYDQPRYKCIACLDRGLVEIWHPAEVVRFVGGLKDKPTCFCTVDCCCDAGNRELHKDYKRHVVYDPTKHCRVNGWESMQRKRDILRAWLAERRRIENHPNYASEFAEFAIWAFLAFTAIG